MCHYYGARSSILTEPHINQIQSKICHINLLNLIHSLICLNPREWMFSVKSHSLLSHAPLIYHGGLTLKSTTREFQPHARTHHVVIVHCHYCNAGFMLFHDVICYTNSLLSPTHVNTIKILNIMCTLVATSMMLWSLECIGVLKRKVTT